MNMSRNILRIEIRKFINKLTRMEIFNLSNNFKGDLGTIQLKLFNVLMQNLLELINFLHCTFVKFFIFFP